MAQPRRSQRRTSLAFVACALLLPALLPNVGADHEPVRSALKPGVTYEWWDADGPEGPNAWHFRVPVLVRPRLPDEVTPAPFATIEGVRNFPARIEIDFTDAVRRVGEDGSTAAWPRDSLGRLSSWTFDISTVRVVAYNYDSGRVNRDMGQSGLLSSRVLPGLLENKEEKSPVFNATSNAVATVFFVIPGAWTSQTLVFVYFDTQENGAKPEVTYSAKDLGILDSLHWTGAATTVFGYIPRRPNPAYPTPTVAVLATQDNTTVRFQVYGAVGLPPTEVPWCPDDANALYCAEGGGINARLGVRYPTIGTRGGVASQTILLRSQTGTDFFFRMDSSRPVVAYIVSEGVRATDTTAAWFPALDGGLVGTEFRFLGLGNQIDEPSCSGQCAPPKGDGPNGIRFVAFDKSARVTVSDVLTQPLISDTFDVPAGTSFAANGDVVYSPMRIYRVVSSAPIAVSATGWSSTVGVPGITQDGSPVGSRLVAPVSTLTSVTTWGTSQTFVYNYDVNGERIPVEGTIALAPSGASSSWSHPQDSHSLHGEIWTAQASGSPISMVSGAVGMWGFGGRGLGTEFRAPFYRTETGIGPYGMIIPLYDETDVTVENLNTATGKPFYAKTLGENDFTTRRSNSEPALLTARDGGRATTYKIVASKPIVVLGIQDPGGGSYGAVLGGRLSMPDHEFGVASFYGCVIGWHPEDKSQSATAKPDDTLAFKYRVLNLGSDLGGVARRDNIPIAYARGTSVGKTDDWKLTTSTSQVNQLRSGEAAIVTLTVIVPATAKSGDSLEVLLTATAGCNPLIQDEARARITVQTKFAFDMVFENGKKTVTRSLSQDERDVALSIRVRNLGTGNDTLNFTLAKAAGDRFGFTASLVEAPSSAFPEGRPLVGADGLRVGALAIGVGETRTIHLRIRAPDTSDALPEIPFTVEGVSGADASVTDQVTASILLNAVTNLRLEVAQPLLPLVPGGDVRFEATVVNLGAATDVELSRVAPLRSFPGWRVNLSCATCRAVEGAEEELLVGAIGSAGSPEDRLRFALVVRASAGAPVDTVLTAKLVARAVLGDAESTVVTGIVANSFALDVVDVPPLPVLPGETAEVRFLVQSRMNGPVTAEIVPTSLPAGWSLASREPVGTFPLAPGQSVVATPRIHVRDNERPGEYGVKVGLQMEDVATKERRVEEVNISFRVLRDVRLNLTLPTGLQSPPGGTVRVPVLVANVGNQRAEGGVSIVAPTGWTLAVVDGITPVVDLAPGESRYVNFSLKAPASTPAAASFIAHAVVPPSGVPIVAQTDVPFAIGVLRRDLKVESVTALTQDFREGRTAVFEIAVRNNGTLPATDVEVALVVNGDVARNVTIRSLPPGEARVVPLSWTVTPASEVTVVVDPRARVSDDDRSNNAFTFPLPKADGGILATIKQKVPGPGILAALASIAVALALRRRHA